MPTLIPEDKLMPSAVRPGEQFKLDHGQIVVSFADKKTWRGGTVIQITSKHHPIAARIIEMRQPQFEDWRTFGKWTRFEKRKNFLYLKKSLSPDTAWRLQVRYTGMEFDGSKFSKMIDRADNVEKQVSALKKEFAETIQQFAKKAKRPIFGSSDNAEHCEYLRRDFVTRI